MNLTADELADAHDYAVRRVQEYINDLRAPVSRDRVTLLTHFALWDQTNGNLDTMPDAPRVDPPSRRVA